MLQKRKSNNRDPQHRILVQIMYVHRCRQSDWWFWCWTSELFRYAINSRRKQNKGISKGMQICKQIFDPHERQRCARMKPGEDYDRSVMDGVAPVSDGSVASTLHFPSDTYLFSTHCSLSASESGRKPMLFHSSSMSVNRLFRNKGCRSGSHDTGSLRHSHTTVYVMQPVRHQSLIAVGIKWLVFSLVHSMDGHRVCNEEFLLLCKPSASCYVCPPLALIFISHFLLIVNCESWGFMR